MAIWDFRPRGDIWTSVAVGAGIVAAPVVIPLAWSATRPVLKAILKGGFMLYETGRQMLGETSEGTRGMPALPRRTKKSGEEEEEVIGQIRAVEESARGGAAKPKPRAPKPRKKPETKK